MLAASVSEHDDTETRRRALAALPEKPKRSILFVTVFGEETGGYGARYYTTHPIFPLAKTVADINLEQLGRTHGAVDQYPEVQLFFDRQRFFDQ